MQADPPAPSTEEVGDSKSKVAEPDPKVLESASAVPSEHAASESAPDHVSPDVGQGGSKEVPANRGLLIRSGIYLRGM